MKNVIVGFLFGLLVGAAVQTLTQFKSGDNNKFKAGTFACATNPQDGMLLKFKVLGTHKFTRGTGVWITDLVDEQTMVISETVLQQCQ